MPAMPKSGSSRKREYTPDLSVLERSGTRPSYVVETPSGSFRETWIDPKALEEGPRKSRRTSNASGVPETEMAKGMSVWERLQLGTLARFYHHGKHPTPNIPAPEDEKDQRPLASPTQRGVATTTVVKLQQTANQEFGLEELTHLHAADREQLESGQVSEMIIPVVAQRSNEEIKGKELDLHVGRREGFAIWAGLRLQAITGTRNARRFSPCDHASAWLVPDQWLEIGEEDLRGLLEDSCAKNGYRRLELDRCIFKSMHRGIRSAIFGGDPNHPGAWSAEDMEPCIEMDLDSETGSITIIETNVRGPDGKTRTWMWFRAKKPLVDLRGERHPAEMPEASESEMMFAVPTLQVAVLREEWEVSQPLNRAAKGQPLQDRNPLRRRTRSMNENSPRPNLRPRQRLLLTFQLSKDGVPHFACTTKPEKVVEDRYCHEGYLWAGRMRGVAKGKANMFWGDFVYRARANGKAWFNVQHAMKTYECMMEVMAKPGSGWEYFPPKHPAHGRKLRSRPSGDSGGASQPVSCRGATKNSGRRRSETSTGVTSTIRTRPVRLKVGPHIIKRAAAGAPKVGVVHQQFTRGHANGLDKLDDSDQSREESDFKVCDLKCQCRGLMKPSGLRNEITPEDSDEERR